MKINDETNVALPLRNLLSIIGAVAVADTKVLNTHKNLQIQKKK
jgi:hypothetical protein